MLSAAKTDEKCEGMADKKRIELHLKRSGELVDARHALNVLEDLRSMQRVWPTLFEALVAIAEGHPDRVPPEQVTRLQYELYLDKEGHIPSDIASILTASLETRDNSHVLVQPFRLENEQERLMAERAFGQLEASWQEMLSEIRKSGPSRN